MDKKQFIEPSGVLIVNKPEGCTSHDVVNIVRRLYNTKRVGHTGTLDPMATGVLVVLVGRAAKAAEYFVSDEKKYRATLRLGITTDTEDTTGKILSESDSLPTKEAVLSASAKFVGKVKQIPPMYSALKVDGKKLYDLARSGVTVEREAREIEVFSLECTPTDRADEYILDVHCSSGTYIRTLCADIGASLGCGGAMATLNRTMTGGFSIDDSVSLDELREMSEDELFARLLPTESLFDSLKTVRLPAFYEKLCRSGCEIYQKKIGSSLPVGEKVRILDADGSFFALGEVRDYPDGSAIKSIKTFVLD